MADATPVLEAAVRSAAPEPAPGRLHAGSETHAPWVWVNGGVARSDTLRVHYFTHALHYGSGVFEGIRCYDTPDGPAIFRLDDHMRRLVASGRVYGMRLPYDAAALAAADLDVLEDPPHRGLADHRAHLRGRVLRRSEAQLPRPPDEPLQERLAELLPAVAESAGTAGGVTAAKVVFQPASVVQAMPWRLNAAARAPPWGVPSLRLPLSSY